MEYTNKVQYSNPHEMSFADEPRSVVTRAGMSVVEMVAWLAIMAVLCVGMIWIMSAASR